MPTPGEIKLAMLKRLKRMNDDEEAMRSGNRHRMAESIRRRLEPRVRVRYLDEVRDGVELRTLKPGDEETLPRHLAESLIRAGVAMAVGPFECSAAETERRKKFGTGARSASEIRAWGLPDSPYERADMAVEPVGS